MPTPLRAPPELPAVVPNGSISQEIRLQAETTPHFTFAAAELEAVYEEAPLGLAVFDLQLRYLRINAMLAAVNGIPANEHIGRTVEEIVPSIAPAVRRVRDRLLATGKPMRIELEGETPAQPGIRRAWTEHWYPIRNREGDIIALGAMVEEITAERQEQRRLLTETAMLADAMPQLVWTAQPDGRLNYCNSRISAYARALRTADGTWEWMPLVHPADLEDTLSAWEKALRTGEAYQITHRVQIADGSFRWHLTRAVPVRDAQARITKWFGTTTDIHEQKTSEERLEAVVQERTAKLQDTVAELESFSYSISHDLRAPLRAMQSFAGFLKEEYEHSLDETANGYLARMIRAAERMDRLIQDVLKFSRLSRAELPMEPVDLSSTISDIVATYPNLPDASIKVSPGIPPVLANRGALTQCMANLLGNSVKFAHPQRPARVEISGQRTGDTVDVVVRDNGIGIPATARPHIFDMFYKGHGDTEGTGIGLTIARKAAVRMGGSLALENASDQGTTFVLTLRAG